MKQASFWSNEMGMTITAPVIEERKHTVKMIVDGRVIIKKKRQLIQN